MKKSVLYSSYIILAVILLIAGFLRLYRIGDYMGFLGDEGRDALVVKRMIVDHKFTLLGPITSVGLMHLGPVYYYFMAPFLALTRLDPVGPAIMVALFSLATILLIFKTGKDFFSIRAGLIASLLYALSPLVIIYSHSSWNPNILPFWAMLIIYSLLQAVIDKRYAWFAVTGAAIGIVIQLHYVALVFIPITIGILALDKFKISIKYWLALIGSGVLTFSPFILFEVRHAYINTLTLWNFVTRGGDAKSFGVMTFIDRFWDLSVRLYWRLVVVQNAEISIILMGVVLGIFGYLFITARFTVIKKSYALLILWYVVGIGFLSLYTGNIYDYYLMFAFPLPFLLVGIVSSKLMQLRITKWVSALAIAAIFIVQLQNTPIAKEPNRLKFQAQEIAMFILGKTQGQPYNFALMATGNSDHAYRYFLEIYGHPPVTIENESNDPERQTVTDQLFVVCEEEVCQPLGHPLWEIAGYGRAEISDEWNVGLFKIFRLVPYEV